MFDIIFRIVCWLAFKSDAGDLSNKYKTLKKIVDNEELMK